MQLVSFRVQNYRSVNDSGLIEVRQRTALVGRNESGKTNLLLALQSLNAPGRKLPSLTYVKDFPRDRNRSEFSEDLPVVQTVWKLTEVERDELAKVFPRARSVEEVAVERPYRAVRRVAFVNLPAPSVDASLVNSHLGRVANSIGGSFQGKDEAVTQPIKAALELFRNEVGRATDDSHSWASSTERALGAFKQATGTYGLPNLANEALDHIEQLARQFTGDQKALQNAMRWIVDRLPVFIYLDDYPSLAGHQDIQAYLARRGQGNLTDADTGFEKLMKVAELQPDELHELRSGDHEQRNQLANRAGAVVTREIRRLWKDRELTVRFNLDEQHFDTFIWDPESVYPVEVNLDERSRGFKWFFSFYITFAADTRGGPAENAVLLLDEPGLHLHMVAQRNLLDHFKSDFTNTIIFTTHSPFMIPVDDIPAIRTVNISPETATTVTNDPTGDSRTLSPIMTAIGYDLTQTLFIGTKNLVVEGVSDYWYLSPISEYLAEQGGISLPSDLVLTPAGGAQKVPYMVALLTAHRLRVLVLLDSEAQARRTALEQLIKEKLIREEYVIFAGEGLSPGTSIEADVEDLLDASVYDKLVQESYSNELASKQLTLNPKIPRIVRRYETAFQEIGLEFNKMRPAKRFLRRIAEDPAAVLSQTGRERFERLFSLIRERLEKLLQRDPEPFD